MECVTTYYLNKHLEELDKQSAEEEYFNQIQSNMVDELMAGCDASYSDDELSFDISQDEFLTELCEVYGAEWPTNTLLKLVKSNDAELKLDIEKKLLDVAEKLVEQVVNP